MFPLSDIADQHPFRYLFLRNSIIGGAITGTIGLALELFTYLKVDPHNNRINFLEVLKKLLTSASIGTISSVMLTSYYVGYMKICKGMIGHDL